MSKHSNKESDTTITIEAPRFDRPEVEIRASTRRKEDRHGALVGESNRWC